jgi:hypothetical protein
LLKVPWAAHGTRQHSVGAIIINKTFVVGVPSQLSAEHHRDITNMRYRKGAVAALSRVVARLSRFDTIKEVSLLAAATRV